MRTRLIVIIFFCLVLCSIGAIAAEAVFITDQNNCRDRPSVEGKIVAVPAKGTTCEIISQKDRWYEVALPDGTKVWTSQINLKMSSVSNDNLDKAKELPKPKSDVSSRNFNQNDNSHKNSNEESIAFIVRSPDLNLLVQVIAAINANNLKEVKTWVRDRGVNIKAVNYVDKTNYLMMAAKQAYKLEMIEFLVDSGIDIEAKDSKGKTALMYACESNGNSEVIDLLLRKGANVSATDNLGNTILFYATGNRSRSIISGEPEILKIVLKSGVSINHKNASGVNALISFLEHITYGRNTETRSVIKYLLQAGAEVSTTNSFGQNALICAVMKTADLRSVDLILKNCKNINHQDSDGKTALMYAAERNTPEIVKLLLDAGADKKLFDKSNKTAYDYSQKNYALDSIRELIKPD